MAETVTVQHRQTLEVRRIPDSALPAFASGWRVLTAAQAAFEENLRGADGAGHQIAATTAEEGDA